jgi:3HB-oligomer hydrolase (3HBOH)
MASATTDALTLPLRFRSQRAAFNAATPNLFAFKHAHSHANPENDWARNVLRSIEFAFDLLNEICRGRGVEFVVPRKTHSSENGHGGVS